MTHFPHWRYYQYFSKKNGIRLMYSFYYSEKSYSQLYCLHLFSGGFSTHGYEKLTVSLRTQSRELLRHSLIEWLHLQAKGVSMRTTLIYSKSCILHWSNKRVVNSNPPSHTNTKYACLCILTFKDFFIFIFFPRDIWYGLAQKCVLRQEYCS